MYIQQEAVTESTRWQRAPPGGPIVRAYALASGQLLPAPVRFRDIPSSSTLHQTLTKQPIYPHHDMAVPGRMRKWCDMVQSPLPDVKLGLVAIRPGKRLS